MKKSWFTITKINEYIYAFAEFNHWEQVVSYLIIDKTQAFLIDTGMGYASIKDEINKITQLPITVLLTHAHWDHIGGADQFGKIYIYNHAFEKQSLEKGFYSKNIPELNQNDLFSTGFLPKTYLALGNKKYLVCTDQQLIKSNSFHIEIIHTPGHTPGSVCYFIPELNSLLTGDTLYPGPLYTQLPESDLQSYIKSIKKLAGLFNSELSIYPGHNAIISQKNLLNEALVLFTSLEKIPRANWKSEVAGKLLSIKLIT